MHQVIAPPADGLPEIGEDGGRETGGQGRPAVGGKGLEAFTVVAEAHDQRKVRIGSAGDRNELRLRAPSFSHKAGRNRRTGQGQNDKIDLADAVKRLQKEAEPHRQAVAARGRHGRGNERGWPVVRCVSSRRLQERS